MVVAHLEPDSKPIEVIRKSPLISVGIGTGSYIVTMPAADLSFPYYTNQSSDGKRVKYWQHLTSMEQPSNDPACRAFRII